MATRKEMEAELKLSTIPLLRTLGFKGSYPHLRRDRNGFVDILAIQFSAWGGAFCVEVGKVGPGGAELADGRIIPLEKVKHNSLRHRYRLGSNFDYRSDHWFEFDHADPSVLANVVNNAITNPRLWRLIDTMPARNLDLWVRPHENAD